jgi:6,7-dimethyl-8-ribityllumazine synthase
LTSSEAARLDPSDIEGLEARGAHNLGGDPVAGASLGPVLWIVSAKFNGGISVRLCHGVLDALDAFGLGQGVVNIAWVPGAFELPLAASRAVTHGRAEAVVCLGAVIRGDTPHFDFVAGECASGIQRVALDTGVPVVFGVLTTNTVEQAIERSNPGPSNKGYEAAVTALEMLDLLPRVAAGTTAAPAAH